MTNIAPFSRQLLPQRGYHLVEILFTLCVLSILLGMALPAFSNVLRNAQSQTVLYSLVNAYQLARSTAIHQRKSVVFCAKADTHTCGNDWMHGALAFVDTNDNRSHDADERFITELSPPPPGSQLVMKAALNKQYLRFMPNGMLENTAGSIVYCPPGANTGDARNLIFSRNGRLRFGYDNNRDGIPENAEGQPLSCPL